MSRVISRTRREKETKGEVCERPSSSTCPALRSFTIYVELLYILSLVPHSYKT